MNVVGVKSRCGLALTLSPPPAPGVSQMIDAAHLHPFFNDPICDVLLAIPSPQYTISTTHVNPTPYVPT